MIIPEQDYRKENKNATNDDKTHSWQNNFISLFLNLSGHPLHQSGRFTV